MVQCNWEVEAEYGGKLLVSGSRTRVERLQAEWFILMDETGKVEDLKVSWSEPTQTYKELGLLVPTTT